MNSVMPVGMMMHMWMKNMNDITVELRLLIDLRDTLYKTALEYGDWGRVKDADLRITEFMQNNTHEILALMES